MFHVCPLKVGLYLNIGTMSVLGIPLPVMELKLLDYVKADVSLKDVHPPVRIERELKPERISQ